MILENHARQLSAAVYHGQVCAFNYCINNFTDLTLEELVTLRDAMVKAAELVKEHGVVTVIP